MSNILKLPLHFILWKNSQNLTVVHNLEKHTDFYFSRDNAHFLLMQSLSYYFNRIIYLFEKVFLGFVPLLYMP